MSSRKVKSQRCDLGFLDRARHVPMTHTRLFSYSHHLSRSLHRCPRPAASLHRPSISMCLNLGESTWTSLLPTGILRRYGCLSRSIRVYDPMRSWDNLPALKSGGPSGTEAQGPLVVTNCGWARRFEWVLWGAKLVCRIYFGILGPWRRINDTKWIGVCAEHRMVRARKTI